MHRSGIEFTEIMFTFTPRRPLRRRGELSESFIILLVQSTFSYTGSSLR